MRFFKIIVLCSVAFVGCRSGMKSAHHDLDEVCSDPLRRVEESIKGKGLMTFESVALNMQMIDQWDRKILDKMLVNVEGDAGELTFYFRVPSESHDIEYEITTIHHDSNTWEECKHRQVIAVCVAVGDKFETYYRKGGVYIKRKK